MIVVAAVVVVDGPSVKINDRSDRRGRVTATTGALIAKDAGVLVVPCTRFAMASANFWCSRDSSFRFAAINCCWRAESDEGTGTLVRVSIFDGATAPKGRGGMVRILDVVQGNGSCSFLGGSGSVFFVAAVVLDEGTGTLVIVSIFDGSPVPKGTGGMVGIPDVVQGNGSSSFSGTTGAKFSKDPGAFVVSTSGLIVDGCVIEVEVFLFITSFVTALTMGRGILSGGGTLATTALISKAN